MRSAFQWNDVFESHPPAFLKDLPCDHWVVKDDPEEGRQSLVCVACGWYRLIPYEGAGAARKLREVIDSLFKDEDD